MAALFDVGSAAAGSCAAWQPEHVGQREAGAEGADLQEVAAADAVAEPLLVAPERQHERSPNGEKAGGWGGNRRCRWRASRPTISTSKSSLNDCAVAIGKAGMHDI